MCRDHARNSSALKIRGAYSACLFLVGSLICGSANAAVPHRTGDESIPKAPQAITTTYANSAEDLLDCLAGSDVVITNAVLTSSPLSAGTFTGALSVFGFDDGIVLSSGDIRNIVGPNLSDQATGSFGAAGDNDISDMLGGIETYDAAVLEFDCQCAAGASISMQYLFGSEEYNEYVHQVNDAFAFFVDGVPIALVPEGCDTPGLPVTINNVNCGNPYAPPDGVNCGCYRNNDLDDGGGSIDTEMDGLTQTFFATVDVGAGTHHVKIAIADALDTAFDSAVLIRCGSLTCSPPPRVGACCFENGQCVSLAEEDCTSQGGSYRGDEFPCEPNPCQSSDVEDDAEPESRLDRGAAPNPFDATTTIRYSLQVAGPVSIALFDAGGRLVREWTRSEQSPGDHAITWDGGDDAGRRLPAGVYLVRIRTQRGDSTRRLVLSR